MRFAVDTGGTFTDLVIEDDSGRLEIYKSATTPSDPVDGILNVFEVAAEQRGVPRSELLASASVLIHGTTRGLNAVLTGNTARTAFLTTEGHPDILLFREGGRTEIFDLSVPYPEPYVPRALTFEVPERVGPDGAVLRPLDEEALRNTIARLKELDVEAVGVCLLWSIVNPAHERRVGELLEEHLPDVALTLSHELNPCLREYRRASSTCIDASLKPLMTRYIRTVEERLREAGFGGRVLIVTSAGAALDAADVAAGADPLAELRPVDGAGGGTAFHGNRRHGRDGGRRRHRRYELRRQRRAARPHPVDARELDRPAVLRAHDRVAVGGRTQRRRRRGQHRARRQRRPAARRARECRCRPGAGLLRRSAARARR